MNTRPAENPDTAGLAKRIGHDFSDPALLDQALTHPSVTQNATESYERLEFLGDRVLGLIVSESLVAQFKREPEGALAKRLAALVRRETLAEIARELALGEHLRLARAERQAGEHDNPALLADCCEAVIGALYLDGGLEIARGFVERHWHARIKADLRPPQDAKTALQEWAQGRGLDLPVYHEVSCTGPAHDPHFTIQVSVAGQSPAQGEGRSKRQAEQQAAERLLDRLGQR